VPLAPVGDTTQSKRPAVWRRHNLQPFRRWLDSSEPLQDVDDAAGCPGLR
jgi:hypothetical protein